MEPGSLHEQQDSDLANLNIQVARVKAGWEESIEKGWIIIQV